MHRPGPGDRLGGCRPGRPAADAGRQAAVLHAAGPAAASGLGGAGPLAGPAARRLPAVHNQIVLAVETFTDPARHAGACYAAAGFTCAGSTAGYARGAGGAGYLPRAGEAVLAARGGARWPGRAGGGGPVGAVRPAPAGGVAGPEPRPGRLAACPPGGGAGRSPPCPGDPPRPRRDGGDRRGGAAGRAHRSCARSPAMPLAFGQHALAVFGARWSDRAGGYVAAVGVEFPPASCAPCQRARSPMPSPAGWPARPPPVPSMPGMARRLAARLPARAAGGTAVAGAVRVMAQHARGAGLRRRAGRQIKMLGSLPVIVSFCRRLGIAERHRRLVPIRDVATVTAGQAVEAMICNRLTSPAPLVHVQDWARTWAVPEILGIAPASLERRQARPHPGCDRPAPGPDHLRGRRPRRSPPSVSTSPSCTGT